MSKIALTSFVGSQNVLQHIILVHETKAASRLKLVQSKQLNFPGAEHGVNYGAENDKKNIDDDVRTSGISKELAADEKDVVGTDVFGFKSTKLLPFTRKPDAGDDHKHDEDDGSLSDNSSTVVSDNSSGEDESSSVACNLKQKSRPKKNSKPANTKTSRMKACKSPAYGLQPYFENQCSSVTSDHTLSRLNTSRMEYSDVIAALQGVKFVYAAELEAMYASYKKLYDTWLFQICEHGFNLLLHGIGSKRRVIDNFITADLSNHTHVVVNGYFPGLTIKNILNSVTEDVLQHTGSFQNPVEQCEFIRQHFETDEYMDLFIIIHNIDGMSLRSHKVQMILSVLACIPGIHIVASIDHINSHLLWDQTMMSRFNWLVYDVTTFEHYTDEASYENSLLVQQAGSLQLSSLFHVMHSLTQNARGIFMMLAHHQLDNRDNSAYIGLSFTDLYQKCREAFLVNSDLTLQSQLTEFRDHKLLRIKKAVDGMEYLRIALESSTLAEFVEQYEQNL